MFNKSLVTNRLIYFPLITEAVNECNMENKCLEIGIVVLPSFPSDKSYSTFKAWLKYCTETWEDFLDAGPSFPPFPLNSNHCLTLSP